MNAEDLRKAEFLVLPGVGSFAAAMHSWTQRDLVAPIRARILEGVPTLAICLGMQLLCNASEESGGVEGLQIIDCDVRSFTNEVRIPHLGWNNVEVSTAEFSTNAIVKNGFAYFAHSFRLIDAPRDAKVGITYYNRPFIASIELRNILACQFHPELSGRWGSELIKNWLYQKETLC